MESQQDRLKTKMKQILLSGQTKPLLLSRLFEIVRCTADVNKNANERQLRKALYSIFCDWNADFELYKKWNILVALTKRGLMVLQSLTACRYPMHSTCDSRKVDHIAYGVMSKGKSSKKLPHVVLLIPYLSTHRFPMIFTSARSYTTFPISMVLGNVFD
jgi:hypothetical protein